MRADLGVRESTQTNVYIPMDITVIALVFPFFFKFLFVDEMKFCFHSMSKGC